MSEQQQRAELSALWASALSACAAGERFGVESLHNYTAALRKELVAAGWEEVVV